MVEEITIIGLLIRDRIKESGKTQQILTRHAHLIRSRLGFHEVSEDVCSRIGIILLQVTGEKGECEQLLKELGDTGGVEVSTMVFKL